MISDQFKQDYRQLTAQGVEFTPEDIVRLNALSVKTRLSRTAARSVHLPRLSFMPADSWWRAPLVFREPTVAHDLWIEMARRWIDTSNGVRFYFLYAFALSRHPGKLPDADNPKKVIKAVYTFAAKRLCTFTFAQLRAAIDYALFGADWTAGESGPDKEDAARSGVRALPSSPTLGLLTEARMLRLPISLDDAKRMTSSELTEAINRAWDIDGKFDPDRSHNRAFREYVRAREEIRRRCVPAASERKDPPDDGGNQQ